MAIEIKAPKKWPEGKFTIFLAGSIDQGASAPWASEVAEALADYDVVCLNPRRDDWDSDLEQTPDNPTFREQVEWENKGLTEADFRIFNVLADSKSPITLMEMGEYGDRPGVICCPEEFYRSGNVELLAEREGIPIKHDQDEMIKYVKVVLDDKGLRRNTKTSSGDRILRRTYESLKASLRKAAADPALQTFMDTLKAITYRNPINPGERVWEDCIAIDCSPFDGAIHLSTIRSFERGEGNASRALDVLCRIADKSGASIVCSAVPFGSKAMNKAKLTAWYQRHGFVKEGQALVYKPKTTLKLRDEMKTIPMDRQAGAKVAAKPLFPQIYSAEKKLEQLRSELEQEDRRTPEARVSYVQHDEQGNRVAIRSEPKEGYTEQHTSLEEAQAQHEAELKRLRRTIKSWETRIRKLVAEDKQQNPENYESEEPFNLEGVDIRIQEGVYRAYWHGRCIGQAMPNSWPEEEFEDKTHRCIYKSWVDAAYRRQGVATLLYDRIAEDLKKRGLTLVPSPSRVLSDDALGMWSRRAPEAVRNDGRWWEKQYVCKTLDLDGVTWKVEHVGGQYPNLFFHLVNAEGTSRKTIKGEVGYLQLGQPETRKAATFVVTAGAPPLSFFVSDAVGSVRVDVETSGEGILFEVTKADKTGKRTDVGSIEISDFGEGEAGVFKVAIEPAWRGKGIGRALYLFVAEYLRDHGFTRLHSDATSMTDGAIGLWKSLERTHSVEENDDYGPRYTWKLAAGSGTDSPAFKVWFGSSKIVDGEGHPLPVHHGTEAEFDTFDRAQTKSGPSKFGFWFAKDKDFAELFGSRQMCVFLKMERPYKIGSDRWNDIRDQHAKDTSWFERWRDKLIAAGHDGLVVEGKKFITSRGWDMSDPTVYAVFNASQIKSAENNSGAFDSGDGRITASGKKSLPERTITTTKGTSLRIVRSVETSPAVEGIRYEAHDEKLGEIVGDVKFGENDDRTYSAMSLWVDPAQRRKGIASALYDAAEADGLNLAPSGQNGNGGKLSPNGADFWYARHRKKNPIRLTMPRKRNKASADLGEIMPKTAYISPTHGQLTIVVEQAARNSATISLDLGIPNFPVMSITLPLEKDAPLGSYVLQALSALLDDMSAQLLGRKFPEQVISELYGSILTCFKGMSLQSSSDQGVGLRDGVVKMFEGEFELSTPFVEETQERVVLANKKIVRTPAKRELELTPVKPSGPTEAIQAITLYRNQLLKSAPKQLYLQVTEGEREFGEKDKTVARNWQSRLLQPLA